MAAICGSMTPCRTWGWRTSSRCYAKLASPSALLDAGGHNLNTRDTMAYIREARPRLVALTGRHAS